MGLFSFARRQKAQLADAPEAFVWEALDGGVIERAGSWMDDDGCSGEMAYGADFQLESAVGAILTAWFYSCPKSAREEDGFAIGRRYQHSVYEDGRCAWTASTYDMADAQGLYRDLETADAGARRLAEAFAVSTFTGRPGSGDGTGFDWDGQPW